MFKEYGELSTILYEHTKPPGHSVGGDIEYYAGQLKGISAPILEAGVGTGRVLIPLISQGLEVDGVDLSPEMLAQCRINLEKHGLCAELFQQDLTNMSLPNKYGAIIMPTGSFCLLPRNLVRDVLASFFNHLADHGKIIIDLLLPVDFVKGETKSGSYPLEGSTGILSTSHSKDIDWVAQKISYIHRYELLKDGEVQKTEVSHFVLHWYGISEFEMMLAAAGFSEINHVFGYGNDNRSHLITFTAIKK